jgi:hypothetical protein
MDNLRILGIAAPSLSFENVRLLSDINLHEFDTIVFQPWDVFRGSTETKHATVVAVQKKLNQLAEWVQLGNTIIVALSRVPTVAYREQNLSRNPIRNLDLLAAPLFGQSKFSVVSGSRIEYADNSGARAFFEKFIGNLKYEYVIHHQKLEPLLRVSGASTHSDAQVVSGYFALGKGRVVLVPPIDAATDAPAQGDYFNSLPALLSCLENQTNDLPDWIDRWQTAREREERGEIESARLQIKSLLADIAQHELVIAKDKWLFNLPQPLVGTLDYPVATCLMQRECALQRQTLDWRLAS